MGSGNCRVGVDSWQENERPRKRTQRINYNIRWGEIELTLKQRPRDEQRSTRTSKKRVKLPPAGSKIVLTTTLEGGFSLCISYLCNCPVLMDRNCKYLLREGSQGTVRGAGAVSLGTNKWSQTRNRGQDRAGPCVHHREDCTALL